MLEKGDVGFIIYSISQVVLVVKNLPANTGNMRLRFNHWVGKVPWRREWQPTPVSLSGEFHRQRSLVGYSPQGRSQRVRHDCRNLAHTDALPL